MMKLSLKDMTEIENLKSSIRLEREIYCEICQRFSLEEKLSESKPSSSVFVEFRDDPTISNFLIGVSNLAMKIAFQGKNSSNILNVYMTGKRLIVDLK